MPDFQDHRPAVERGILVIERVAGVMLGVATLLIVLSAVGRYGFARPLPDAFDLSRLILGIAIAWGFASLGYHGSHIKVDLLAHGLPLVLRRVMNAFAWAVLLGFTVLLCWKIGERVQSAVAGGDVTMDLRLPHWVFFLAIWLGMLAALFTTGLRLWLIAARGRGLGEYDGIETHLDTPGEPK